MAPEKRVSLFMKVKRTSFYPTLNSIWSGRNTRQERSHAMLSWWSHYTEHLCSIILNRLRKIQTTQRKQSAAGIFDVPKINKRPKKNYHYFCVSQFSNWMTNRDSDCCLLLRSDYQSKQFGEWNKIVRDFIECRITSNWLTRERYRVRASNSVRRMATVNGCCYSDWHEVGRSAWFVHDVFMALSWKSKIQAQIFNYFFSSEKWIFWSNCAMRTHTSNEMNTYTVAWQRDNILAIYRNLCFQHFLSSPEIRMQQNKYDLLSFIWPAAITQHFISLLVVFCCDPTTHLDD